MGEYPGADNRYDDEECCRLTARQEHVRYIEGFLACRQRHHDGHCNPCPDVIDNG
jgi:hypothetical protein